MPDYKRLFIDNNYVFITVVTYNRLPLLIENINILRTAFKKTIAKYNYKLVAAVVLPDHFHILIKPEKSNDYPNIIGNIKKHFTYNYNIYNNGASKRRTLPCLNESREKRNESYIWQRRFYEHTIRDETDLNRHLDYIHYNPMKHYNIAPKDYKYSSFAKFVKNGYYDENWCDFESIKDLDYE